MLKQLIRRWKIEVLARKLDPRAFADGKIAAKRQAKESAKAMIATAEGQYDAIGWRPGRD